MSVLPTDEAVIEVVSPDVEKVEPRLSAADSIGTAKEHDIAQTVSSVPSSHPHPGHNYSNARLISLVVCVTGAAFLNTLSVQSFVILLPTIGRDLSIPESRQQWIMSAYALTFGCFLLLFGKLADVYGKRRVFLAGSAWLTVITIVTPFVRNEIVFDLFRGLQGLGSAANVPTAIGILGFTFPPGKAKTYAFAFYGGGAPLGSIFGTILGGVLGQWISWKWIFW